MGDVISFRKPEDKKRVKINKHKIAYCSLILKKLALLIKYGIFRFLTLSGNFTKSLLKFAVILTILDITVEYLFGKFIPHLVPNMMIVIVLLGATSAIFFMLAKCMKGKIM